MLSLLDGNNASVANINNNDVNFIDGANSSHQQVIKIQQVPTAQEANNVDPRGDIEFYPETKPELKIEIPDNGNRSFEDVLTNPAAISENILDKLLLSATATGGIDSVTDASVINAEEAQDWEESLNELFPDLI